MWMIVIEGTKTDLTWSGPFFRSCLYLVRLFSTYDITMHMIPSVEQIFPQDIHLLGAILSDKLSKKRRRTSPSFSTNLQFILSPPPPSSSPSAPEIVSILTRFTIAPRLKSCLMHSIDSQSKLDEQSARSNNDVIGYFARDARMERIFHGKREGGGVRRMDGRNWLIDNSFARNFANSIPYDIFTILRSNFSFQIVTKLQWKLRVRKS